MNLKKLFKGDAEASADAIEIMLLQEKLPKEKRRELIRTVQALLESGAEKGIAAFCHKLMAGLDGALQEARSNLQKLLKRI